MESISVSPENLFSRTSSKTSLQQAKRHVEQYYAVVGLNEDLDSFFQVLEWTLPEFFTGARQEYHNGQANGN